MNQESDDPDDVFMGEVPYDVIITNNIRAKREEEQKTKKEDISLLFLFILCYNT